MFNLFGKPESQSNIKQLNVADFENIRNSEGDEVVILDVRTPGEFAEGAIPDAILIDINGSSFVADTAKLDPSKKYLVYCRSGMRSMKACSYLASKGFEDLSNLMGGYIAWSNES
jgi:rhodanese-related sulfurtransferase